VDPTSESGGSSAHPDLDQLSLLDEGLLDATERAAVDRHLAACATCPARLADVRAVRESLAALPAPAMPADVAERLHATLAHQAAAAPAATTQPARTVSPARWQRRRSWLPATAALGSIAAVIAAITFAVMHAPSGDNGGSAGSAALGRSPASSPAAPPLIHRTGRDYTIDSLRAAVPQLLAKNATRTGDGDATSTSAGRLQALQRLSSRPALATCVSHLGESYSRLLAADYASFGGRPSVVLVFPDPGNQRRVEIFVAGPDCASNANPISQIVFAAR
jgi:hypothetical protein